MLAVIAFITGIVFGVLFCLHMQCLWRQSIARRTDRVREGSP